MTNDSPLPAEPGSREKITARSLVAASRWLGGSTYRQNRFRMTLIVFGQVFGAVGTALGTIAVIFYIRAAVGDGTLGRLNIRIESAAEPATAAIFLTSILAIIFLAALSTWLAERAVADLAREHASRVRKLILHLIEDPLADAWQDRTGFKRPAFEVQQVLVGRIRSMTVALTDVLAVGPSVTVLLVALTVALVVDALAALLLLPFIVLFGFINQKLTRRIQSLTAHYERRQERTRDLLADQLDELFSGHLMQSELSMTRVESEDELFHDRQLESTKLRLFGIISSALLFALTAAFFILFRGAENLSIEQIIVYLFAIRFATRAAQQILKTFAQVSRRFEDIEAISGLITLLDAQRLDNRTKSEKHALPRTLEIHVGAAYPATVSMGQPIIVLSGQPVTEDNATAMLRTLINASTTPDLDFTELARVASPIPGQPLTDILGSSPVRVIITDEPDIATMSVKNTFTFFMHHRPKVLLGPHARKAAKSFGPIFVIHDGEIVWAGSVASANAQAGEVRAMMQALRKQNRKRPSSVSSPAQR